MTAATAVKQINRIIAIERKDSGAPILFVSGKHEVTIRAGTIIADDGARYMYDDDTPIVVDGLAETGKDYGLAIIGDQVAYCCLDDIRDPIGAGFFAGFHFAHSGCAEGKAGGDGVPAINPHSIWDLGFRPSCPDPRGMTLVDGRFWADIYLLGVDHNHGTSRCGVTIADGRDLPERPGCDSKVKRLDYATAVEIYAHHGKRLLGAEEFFAAAYGVQERCSRGDEPVKTGSLDDEGRRFVSRWGLFDAAGTMWQWGTDGHPDDPRPSIFGGSWLYGSDAGSRCADLDYWAELSSEYLSARGASDHLNPA